MGQSGLPSAPGGPSLYHVREEHGRDRPPDRFVAGICLHAGPRPIDLDERNRAVPVCALWG